MLEWGRLGIGSQRYIHTLEPATFLNGPSQSRTSSWWGSRDDLGSFLPARGRAHAPYLVIPAPSLGAGPQGGRGGCRVGERGTLGAGAARRLQGSPQGQGRVPEAFVSASPAPAPPARAPR